MAELEPLADLYELTGVDWLLEVHHVLTEPTCPTVTIRAEDDSDRFPTFQAHGDTIEQGIAAVVVEVIEWMNTLRTGATRD